MRLIIRDQNGNTLDVRRNVTQHETVVDVEASRVEGLNVALSDDSESIVLTVSLEES